MRQIKGILLFIAFIAIAVGLVIQPDEGVMQWMGEHNVSPLWWALGFTVSGVANLYIGFKGSAWNALWFAVFFAYTTMMWVTAVSDVGLTVAQSVSNTLLSAFLVLELLEGAGEWRTLQ